MKNIKNNIDKIKSFSLILLLSVVVIIAACCTSCQKQANTTSNNTIVQPTIDIHGTWMNPNDNTDWFTVSDTTPANTGVARYYIKHYKYSNCCPNICVAVSNITSLPGYYDGYTYSGNNYQCYLSFINGTMKMTGTCSGQPSIIVTYQKQ